MTAAVAASALAAAVEHATKRADEAVPLSRDPLPHEQVVDWARMASEFLAARAALVAAWQHVRSAQARALVSQIRNARTLEDLAAVVAPVSGADLIGGSLAQIAIFGARLVVREALAQGITVRQPAAADLRAAVGERAEVTAVTLAHGLAESARREAVRVAGGPLPKAAVADQVSTHLDSLSDAFLEEQLGGAVQSGLNMGRFVAMDGFPDGTRFAASALLDLNTCEVCRAWDAHEWTDLGTARLVFPVAGNVGCLGRWRCRCTLVSIAPTEAAPSVP